MANLKKFMFPLIALVLGILAIVFGVKGMSEAKNFPEIKALVTDVDKTVTYDSDNNSTEEYTIYVKYTVDGKEYNEILNGGSGNIKEGDEITVRYNHEKPEYVTDVTTKTATLFIVIGAAVTVFGLGSLAFVFIRKR